MGKLDLTKAYKEYYTAKPLPEILQIGAAGYISIIGKGDPSGSLFKSHIQALYSVAYAIKFMHKECGNDFVVAKLEGQWWYDEQLHKQQGITETPTAVPRSEWGYRLLIRMPDYVLAQHVADAIEKVNAKKNTAFAAEVKYFEMEEGKVMQMLHVGPFDMEPATLAQIKMVIEAKGFLKNGHHHEIYLSDFRKTAPEKLTTILREPVKDAG